MIEELEKQIRAVAQARDHRVFLDELKKRRLKEWEDTNAPLLSDIANNTAFLTDAEYRLREMTLLVFNETGNKTPAQGVSVKIFQKLKYNEEEAKEWALAHGIALKLDIPTFEQHAKIERLSFVSLIDEP